MSSLTGMRVVVTRPERQAGEFCAALRTAGAVPICFPVIAIGDAADPTVLDRALEKLDCYDWLVLTSVNGVEAVWKRLEVRGWDVPGDLRIATIGPKTAEAVRKRGVTPEAMPEEYVAEAVVPVLGDLRSRWVLLPRADIARPALAEAIRAAGGVAHEIAAYRTLPAEPDAWGLHEIAEGTDVITFTSSSTVRNFVAVIQKAGLDPHNLPGGPIVACIGPITAQTAVEEGFTVNVAAQEYTTQGLLESLIEFEEARKNR